MLLLFEMSVDEASSSSYMRKTVSLVVPNACSPSLTFSQSSSSGLLVGLRAGASSDIASICES